jgi:hypothetical protein
MNQALHEQDYDRWLEEQVLLLRERKFIELDIDNLIEELEDLGNEQKRAVESLVMRTIEHLLYCEYWEVEKERNINHWRGEIRSFRKQLKRRLTTNLKNHLISCWQELCIDAKDIAQDKTGLSLPDVIYSLEEVLDENYLPF